MNVITSDLYMRYARFIIYQFYALLMDVMWHGCYLLEAELSNFDLVGSVCIHFAQMILRKGYYSFACVRKPFWNTLYYVG